MGISFDGNNNSGMINQQSLLDGGTQETNGKGGQTEQVNGMPIQVPAPAPNSQAANVEMVHDNSTVENVTRMGLPQLSSPGSSGGGYVASLGASVMAVAVDFIQQMNQNAKNSMNMQFQSAMDKIKEQVQTMQQQARTTLGMGVASGVLTLATGLGYAAGGVKSMTAPGSSGGSPSAQLTESKLSLGKEILEGMIKGMDSGKESQITQLGSDIKLDQMEQQQRESSVENVKMFAESLKGLSDKILQMAQEMASNENQTQAKILA